MNSYTLRFKNERMELLYREQSMQQMETFLRFSTCIFSLALVAVIINCIFVVKQIAPVIYFSALLVAYVIMYLIGYYRKPLWIPQLLFIQNILLSLIQCYYIEEINKRTDAPLFQAPHQSFLFGVVIANIHLALMVGPDFAENVLQIFFLFIIKIIIGAIRGPILMVVLMPFVAIFLSYSVYLKQFTSRQSFLRLQQSLHDEYIFKQGFSQGFLTCRINDEKCRIDFVTANSKLQHQFGLYGQKDMQHFLSEIKVLNKKFMRKISMEQWLWNRWKNSNAGQRSSLSQTEGQLSCQIELEQGNLVYLQLKVLSSQVQTMEFNIIITDVTEAFHKDKQDQLIRKQNKTLLTTLIRLNKIHQRIIATSRIFDKNCTNAMERLVNMPSFRGSFVQQCISSSALLFHLKLNLFSNSIQRISKLSIPQFVRCVKAASLLVIPQNKLLVAFHQQNFETSGTLSTCVSTFIHVHLQILSLIRNKFKGVLKINITTETLNTDRLLKVSYTYQSVPQAFITGRLRYQHRLNKCLKLALPAITLSPQLHYNYVDQDTFCLSYALLRDLQQFANLSFLKDDLVK